MYLFREGKQYYCTIERLLFNNHIQKVSWVRFKTFILQFYQIDTILMNIKVNAFYFTFKWTFFFFFQLNKVFIEDEAPINKKLPKELLLRIFSYLDVVSLCRCAQVSKAWNILALDGSNWQRIDLFDFQKDVEVKIASCSWFKW